LRQKTQVIPESTKILAALVSSAEELFDERFPPRNFPGMTFWGDRWDYTRRAQRVQKRDSITFYRGDFSAPKRATATREPLPTFYSAAFRAWMVHEAQKPQLAANGVQAMRYLWHILVINKKADEAWLTNIRDADLRACEVMLRERLLPSSANGLSRRIRKFIDWAQLNDLVGDHLRWQPQGQIITPQTSEQRRRERLDRLPDRAILEALGNIYHNRSQLAERARLAICCLGIMLVCGFRMSELLSLPFDCLGFERHGRDRRWYLKFWKRKGRGLNTIIASKRYLSPLGAKLVCECVHEIKSITKAARKQARVLEATPNRVSLKGVGNRSFLSREETADALGCAPDSLSRLMGLGHVKFRFDRDGTKRGGPLRIARADVETELMRRRGGLYVPDTAKGHPQLLSETLIIEYKLSGNGFRTSKYLVQGLPHSTVHSYLGGSPNRMKSIFNMLPDASSAAIPSSYRLRSHMFRHWLNTVANKAGMTAFQITLWMGRRSVAETMPYLHAASDIAELVRDSIREKKMNGEYPQTFEALQGTDGEEFLSTIDEGHQTADGTCLRSFQRAGCDVAKSCDMCKFFVWSNEVTRPESVAMRSRSLSLRQNLALLQKQRADGVKLHPRQIEIAEVQLERLELRISASKVLVEATNAEK
jgi:integrase